MLIQVSNGVAAALALLPEARRENNHALLKELRAYIGNHADSFVEVDKVPEAISVKESLFGSGNNAYNPQAVEFMRRLYEGKPRIGKLEMIKEIRSRYLVGLKEAKDFVEKYEYYWRT